MLEIKTGQKSSARSGKKSDGIATGEGWVANWRTMRARVVTRLGRLTVNVMSPRIRARHSPQREERKPGFLHRPNGFFGASEETGSLPFNQRRWVVSLVRPTKSHCGTSLQSKKNVS